MRGTRSLASVWHFHPHFFLGLVLPSPLIILLALLPGCSHAERMSDHRPLGAISGLPTSQPAFTYDHGGITRGDRSRRALAIVFTADEYGESTEHILDVLARSRQHASFFLTGNYVRVGRYRPLIRRMVREGHYVGPHSDTHPLYCSWESRRQSLVTRAFFEADLRSNVAALRRLGALADDQPVYFIPPYEWFNAEHTVWAREMGVQIVNFTPGIGSNRDWAPESHPTFRPSQKIYDDILAYERREPAGLNAAILLLHLGSQRQDKMPRLFEPLISELIARRYELLRVDELLR